MQVGIKNFDVGMELKSKGIELEVRDTDGAFRGNLVITQSRLTWCRGRTTRVNGVKISWDNFIKRMED